jgi:predicted house-cleaning NTP pyrophosphatase (Maf/HAM1 superfamily)
MQTNAKAFRKTHQVYTGITIKNSDKTITETDVADVNLMKSQMMK